MKEVNEDVIQTVLGKVYRDTMVAQSKDYFIIHKYKSKDFDFITPEIFHSVVCFLPNTKYRGNPFILSVSYNRGSKEYEITVHNPRVKY